MKIVFFLIITFFLNSVWAQDKVDSTNVSYELNSKIIDHSDVQRYIESHGMVVKKKPFTEGYRIQIFNSNNRDEATAAKSDFYSKFPNMRAYSVYQQPYYKVRVGDYPNPESAKADLKKLARSYPSSFLVPEQIRRIEGKEEEELKK